MDEFKPTIIDYLEAIIEDLEDNNLESAYMIAKTALDLIKSKPTSNNSATAP